MTNATTAAFNVFVHSHISSDSKLWIRCGDGRHALTFDHGLEPAADFGQGEKLAMVDVAFGPAASRDKPIDDIGSLVLENGNVLENELEHVLECVGVWHI
jgi:hypothetical protein